MAWVKIDDQFTDHPKAAKAGPLAWALHLAALCYCNRNLTDGVIPWSVARRLVTWEMTEPPDDEGRRRHWTIGMTSNMAGEDIESQTVIEQLLWSGLWEEHEDGYYIHDYPEYQPTKAQVLAEREAAKGRMREVRKNRKGSSSEVQANNRENFGRSSPNPVPVPNPVPEEGSKEKSLSADRSEITRNGLPVELELQIAKLLKFVGADADEATAGTIRGLSRRLSEGSLAKVLESACSRTDIENRAAYVVGSLKSEVSEREAERREKAQA